MKKLLFAITYCSLFHNPTVICEFSNSKTGQFIFNLINRASQLPCKHLYVRDFQNAPDLPDFSYDIRENFENVQEIYERKLSAIESSLRRKRQFQNLLRSKDDCIQGTYEKEFNDELWPLQWYEMGLKVNSVTSVLDMNLVPVYRKYNLTGRGVNVVIIDDGIEYTHVDIRDNFDPSLSYNLNFNKPDVMPRYEDPRNRHGTRCAGVIVMKPNNGKCGVGIAHGAKIGGISLLDGPTNDLMEARAVTFAVDRVDIYSGSWGPRDDGRSLDGPGHLVSAGLHYGITKGRKGRGSLYVFAAGNGGMFNDHCGADGYVNSIYSIAIASTTQDGGVPYYGERCAAIIATTYSGNRDDEVTTDIHNTCTLLHSGTSASAPFAAGILALVLEANEFLTWRDVQHLLVCSCDISSLTPDVDWAINGSGLWFTPQFGFGLMDAYKLVSLAKKWKNVPRKFVCSVPFDLGRRGNRKFNNKRAFISAVKSEACNFTIQFLEHVQLNVSISYQLRGNLQIELISPYGTVSKLMEPRKQDIGTSGFTKWTFMSMQFWGERAMGTWAVVISDQVEKNNGPFIYRGIVNSLQIIMHGTREIPSYYLNER